MTHFQGKNVHQFVNEDTKGLREHILGMPEEEVLTPPLDHVVERLVNGYRLIVPTLHREDAVRVDYGEVRLPGQPTYAPKALRVEFAVPFDGAEGFFGLTPSRHLMKSFTGQVRNRNELRITVMQANPSKESMEREFSQRISEYETELAYLRADVQEFNDQLPKMVRNLVTSRREKLLRDKDVLASIAVPVRRREDAVIPVPVARKVTIAIPAARPGERFEPEPELLESVYDEILASTRSMGLVMERAPATFSGLAEEGIRDFFLALLNFGFKGDAMGEVFNGAGKTDILIRAKERNVFIAECKVWTGEKDFPAAVDQVLSYLGWRDAKCAILLFVHERALTEIIAKADAVIRAHDCFKQVVDGRSGDLERRYVMHWPGDELRELTLTLQVFAVPSTSATRTRRKRAAET